MVDLETVDVERGRRIREQLAVGLAVPDTAFAVGFARADRDRRAAHRGGVVDLAVPDPGAEQAAGQERVLGGTTFEPQLVGLLALVTTDYDRDRLQRVDRADAVRARQRARDRAVGVVVREAAGAGRRPQRDAVARVGCQTDR